VRGNHPEEGGGPPVGGGGEASSEKRRRARNIGKAKVQDSWCAGWLEKAEASRRKKEEREKEEQSLREAQELRQRDQLTEEQGRRFEQQERALGSKQVWTDSTFLGSGRIPCLSTMWPKYLISFWAKLDFALHT
jgi:hypothetical protein